MRRIALWLLTTLSALVLLFAYHTSTSGALATSAAPAFTSSGGGSGTASGGTGGSSPSSSGSSGSAPPASSTGGSTGGSASGSTGSRTVTGSVAQTRWGPVQVQLTVAAGRITKVEVLQYPNGNGRDVEINDYALPILVQETTDAQSAQIDMVSGATVTSDGYLQSLQSALDQAGL